MKFTYKDKDYELMAMHEPYKNETFGMLAIFEVKYIRLQGDPKRCYDPLEVSKEENYDFEEYEFIDYFCDQENQIENLQCAYEYIDDHTNK